jgi:hypothetical protein
VGATGWRTIPRGEFFQYAGQVPTSRLFDDDDFAARHERGFMVEHLMELLA